MKMGDKNWTSERFLRTPTGYCTEETDMTWEEKGGGGEHKRTSQPLKVPASEVEMGLSKAWPLLAAIPDRNHSTILMTRCLVSLV